LGLQCHPEELWERTDRRWAKMFTGFIEIARERAACAPGISLQLSPR
jgi:hypothetical protein